MTPPGPDEPTREQLADLAEMLGIYIKGTLVDVDQLVAAAEARAREIPTVPGLAREVRSHTELIGMLIIEQRVLCHAIDELLQAAGRPRLHHMSPREFPRSPALHEVAELRAELAALRRQINGEPDPDASLPAAAAAVEGDDGWPPVNPHPQPEPKDKPAKAKAKTPEWEIGGGLG